MPYDCDWSYDIPDFIAIAACGGDVIAYDGCGVFSLLVIAQAAFYPWQVGACNSYDCDTYAGGVSSLTYAHCGGSNMHDVPLGTFVLHLNAQIHFLAWYLSVCILFMIVIS